MYVCVIHAIIIARLSYWLLSCLPVVMCINDVKESNKKIPIACAYAWVTGGGVVLACNAAIFLLE